MERGRQEVGDQDNTSFEMIGENVNHSKPGFESGKEATESREGEHRFPRRTGEHDVPQASLAERIRTGLRRTE
jgi:hypothetical protein